MRWIVLPYLLCRVAQTKSSRPMDRAEMLEMRESVREMLNHAFEGYMQYAYPRDELQPLTCQGRDTWGGYKLTLIDTMDTLLLTGDMRRFRQVESIVRSMSFDIDKNVSVFETNIRIVGGLLSSHLLYKKAGMPLPAGWPCRGPLLDLAVDVANRILPAFNTTTGMPYGSINLRHGVAADETPVTCTSGVGTFIVEFGTISRLTGDMRFENAARRALQSLFDHRSEIGLVGNHIDTMTGRWTATDSGIGAGVDSFFEYLVKGYVLLNEPSLLQMWRNLEMPIEKFLNQNDWYIWANMKSGSTTSTIAQSLDAFFPGMKTLLGEIEPAMRTHLNYYETWRQFNAFPEFYSIGQKLPIQGREGFPLRPEFIESTYYLYYATKDPILLEMGAEFLHSINVTARTECGFATIDSVIDGRRADRMESFFLAETLKYLYLLFDPDHWLNEKNYDAEVLYVDGVGECHLSSDGWIFNTEAHPLDPSALRCCSKEQELDQIDNFIDELDLNDLINESINKFLPSSIDVTCPKLPFYLKLSAWGDVFVN